MNNSSNHIQPSSGGNVEGNAGQADALKREIRMLTLKVNQFEPLPASWGEQVEIAKKEHEYDLEQLDNAQKALAALQSGKTPEDRSFETVSEANEANKTTRINELRQRINVLTQSIGNFQPLHASMGEQVEIVEKEHEYDREKLEEAQKELRELEGQ